MITCALTREQLETLALAAVARELGDDKAALKFLDAYNGHDTGNIEIVSRKRLGKGRPRLKRDLDATAIGLMEHRAQKTGLRRAESLARWVLQHPRYRRADRSKMEKAILSASLASGRQKGIFNPPELIFAYKLKFGVYKKGRLKQG
jgi:hypothetical protein